MRDTMSYRNRRSLTCVLAFMVLLSCFSTISLAVWEKASKPTVVAPTPTTISKSELRRHVAKLASDEFKGRNPSGEGGILAARYVEGEFKKLGLQPAGDDGGYFQSFTLSLPQYLSSQKHGTSSTNSVSTSDPEPQTVSSKKSDGKVDEAAASAPMSEEEIQATAKKLNRWLKKKTVELFFECKSYECRNVLALLPGTDPKLKDEVIIVSAHYDHLGVRDGEVYNGADDNASGTASMLEIARVLANRTAAPRRSILFAAWDAEEKGLCGSWNWVIEPTIPLEKVVAVVNLDMIGRMHDDRLVVLCSESSEQLSDIITARAKRAHIHLRNWDGSARSDHWPFFVSKIPCFTFSTGTHKDYHSPRDDVEWIHFTNLVRIAHLSLGIVDELASRDQRVTFTAECEE